MRKPIVTKICTVCGKKYEAPTGRSKYCPECAKQAIREYARRKYWERQAKAGKTVNVKKPLRDMAQKPVKPPVQKADLNHGATLCWKCAHAVPRIEGRRIYGCPWSERFEDVTGWTVKRYQTSKVETNYYGETHDRIIDHIQVLDCPMFVADGERRKP